MDIQNKILSGEWFNAMLMPTEYELCGLYKVSRITVRKAMEELEKIGLITRVQGKGTFVSHVVVRSGTGSLSKHLRDLGFTVHTRLLKKELISATNDIATKLKISAENPKKVWYFSRVRSIEDTPAAVMNTYVSEEIGNEMLHYDLENESFYKLYETITGKKVVHTEGTVTAIIPNEDVCAILNVKNGSAHIWYKSVGYFMDNQPVEANYSVFNANLYEFSVNMDDSRFTQLY
ncbi:GntR family transcriptional regulator [Spirochaetia bacterium]|nr:GntR family transcriptional regulator [Spirochaetia bacterium]